MRSMNENRSSELCPSARRFPYMEYKDKFRVLTSSSRRKSFVLIWNIRSYIFGNYRQRRKRNLPHHIR